jgi:hypothetical protein
MSDFLLMRDGKKLLSGVSESPAGAIGEAIDAGVLRREGGFFLPCRHGEEDLVLLWAGKKFHFRLVKGGLS